MTELSVTPAAMQTVADQETALLTEIANEAHVSNWKDLRWYHVGGNNPRAIIVLKRGANKERVKTISANIDQQAWESWQPVLSDLLARRANGNRRVSHAELQTGKM